ncbi:complex I NDUFA9 subunit family protein [Piscinibacter sp. XHJ-5]|uniref:complex I NDUFA9 subunit family protein n=1 Tax=Piscinibacter sp. XHJ-5 TaxID=3037797 RepID=UPI0024534D3F|nr:complex I NDUFA9 subunit family protein [Piscinibacter sp. XHJ-5]
MKNILVLGGTGFVGMSVCEKLVERSGGGDGRITVPTRFPNRAGHIQPLPTLEIPRWDPHDDAQLDRLVRGRDAVINLVATLHGSEAEMRRVNVDLPERLGRLCAARGVRRVVHISALGAADDAPSKYLRTKAAGERALTRSGVDVAVLRPSVMFGEHDHLMNRFASLQKVFPVMPLAAAGARFQPVWVDDVAVAIVRLLDPLRTERLVECVGPNTYTLRQLVELAGRWSGHPRPVIALPDIFGRLQAAVFELLPGPPVISRDNLDSMKVPSVASGRAPTLEALGVTPRALESVMPDILGWRQGPARLDPWRALARRR